MCVHPSKEIDKQHIIHEKQVTSLCTHTLTLSSTPILILIMMSLDSNCVSY